MEDLLHSPYPNPDESIELQIRDCSCTSRNASFENTRHSNLTVNTQNSILNITDDSDCDEDATTDRSVLFEDLVEHPTPQASEHCCDLQSTNNNNSILDQVTERFTDSLCFPVLLVQQQQPHSPSDAWLVQQDIFVLLGCFNDPGEEERSILWRREKPKKKSRNERAMALRQLRAERAWLPRTRLSPTSVVSKARSMDDALTVQQYHTTSMPWGMEPIPAIQEQGYDSDPEVMLRRDEEASHTVSSSTPQRFSLATVDNIQQQVQETLNATWTLTWHNGTTVVCHVWMERGTLVHSNNFMLEPQLCWRPTCQVMVRPHSIRLLNLCRIMECTTMNRSVYPLARPSHSLLLKTADEQEFLLEASSMEERDEIVRRWKYCVARFATLAVLEDTEAICDEFFAPILNNKMLLPDYKMP